MNDSREPASHNSCDGARDGSEGLLSRCLVEGDEAALARARRLRRKALIASLMIEAALISALMLLPLFTTNARPALLLATPSPPYYGSHANLQATGGAETHRPTRTRPNILYQPLTVPHHVAAPKDAGPGAEAPLVRGPGPGGELPGVPGGVPPLGLQDPARVPRPPAPVQPTVEHHQRVSRSEGVQQALLINRVQPIYPALAIQARLAGTVQLRAVIGRDGSVNLLEVLSGHPILAKAALDAVGQWRYRPTLLNGEPVEVATWITVVFQLNR